MITASSLVRQWRHRAKVRGFTVQATLDDCRAIVGAIGTPCELCRLEKSTSVGHLFPMEQEPPLVAALLVAVCRNRAKRLRTNSSLELLEFVPIATATVAIR